MTYITANTTTPLPPQYRTPHFPSLYWLIGPHEIVQPAYLYRVKDIWKFTLFWTIIVFEAAHLLAGTYAMVIVWWGSRNDRVKGGMGRKTRGRTAYGWGKVSGMWAVPVVYGAVAGAEAMLAGSVVGLMFVLFPKHLLGLRLTSDKIGSRLQCRGIPNVYLDTICMVTG